MIASSDSVRIENAFAAWAPAYDQTGNPLLKLEERYLRRLLPEMRGCSVLDVGCGTGRWLSLLSRMGPSSLHGVDPSPEMLSQARLKEIPNARLSVAGCSTLPVEDASVDILLASFVLSYESDLAGTAREFARVVKPKAGIFISDVHPDTAEHLRWKRSFRTGDLEFHLPAIRRPISEILETFLAAGFMVSAHVEPRFGRQEKEIFAAHDKLNEFDRAERFPAIYILQFSKGDRPSGRSESRRLFYGGRYALGPDEEATGSIAADAASVRELTRNFPLSSRSKTDIDLTGYLVLPGLLNAHDHLEFALFPKLGRAIYSNARYWAEDIQLHDSDTIGRHRQISKRTRLWWGGIRNLLCGVTTVCHHNPLDPCMLSPDFPVRVVSRMGWEHSLAFGADLQAAHGRTADDEPFLIHCCEGTDEEAAAEFDKLDRLGIIDQRTVLIHGLALKRQQAALLNERGASLIVCPSSNQFLFRSMPSQDVLGCVARLALGSDSPLTAAGDLLDEIRFTAHACGLPAEKVYSMVMDSPASMLRLGEGEGSIRPGARADLMVVRDRPKLLPAEILCSLSTRDIELVVLDGRVHLASDAMLTRLPDEDRRGLEPLAIDGMLRWLRAPVGALLDEAEEVLGKGNVRLGGRSLCQPRL